MRQTKFPELQSQNKYPKPNHRREKMNEIRHQKRVGFLEEEQRRIIIHENGGNDEREKLAQPIAVNVHRV